MVSGADSVVVAAVSVVVAWGCCASAGLVVAAVTAGTVAALGSTALVAVGVTVTEYNQVHVRILICID